jgi:uncharacterized protein GlcG (DUF336 family)
MGMVILSPLRRNGASSLSLDNTQKKGISSASLSQSVRLLAEEAPRGARILTTPSKNKKVLSTPRVDKG